MSEWKKVKLGELCSKVCSGGTPDSKNRSFYGGDIPWLNTKEVDFGRIYRTENTITEEGLNNSAAKWVEANSIVIAMYGNTAGKSAITKIPLTTNQACCNLTIDKDKADYNYVFYCVLKSYEELASMANGAAQKNLNAQMVKGFEIPLPPLATQHRIATILSRYDSLIDNYQKQIKLLEEAAQRLYKEWFIDLHFPGHENTNIIDGEPEGWEKTNVNGIVTFHRGYDLTHNEMVDGEYPVVGSTSIIGTHKDYKINGPGIVTGRSGSLGKFQLIQSDFWPHNTTLYISDFKGHDVYYIYCLLNRLDFASLNNGGAIPTLNRNVLSNISVLEPDCNIQKEFSKIVTPMFVKKKSLQSQLRLLTEARDRLLPKLMSGEIEV